MYRCEFQSDGAEALTTMLETNTTLTIVEYAISIVFVCECFNCIVLYCSLAGHDNLDSGVQALAVALQTNSTLKLLRSYIY
jgi:hypothetical protein